MTWREVRLKSVVREARETIDPSDLAQPLVEHYSIPSLETTGQPDLVSPDWIHSNKQSLQGGEVMLSRLNPRKSRVLRVPELTARPAVASGEFVIMHPTDIDGDFLVYYLLSEEVRQHLHSCVQSVTRSHQRMRPEHLLQMSLRIPEHTTQQAIAEHLDTETARIDALISKKRRLIELLAEHRTALITQTVTKGLPPTAAKAAGLPPNPPLKPSGITWLGDMAKHWTTVRISATARPGDKSFTDGDWVELPYITDSGVRLIQTGNIGTGAYREQGYRYIDESSFDELRCTEVDPGDVLICRLAGPVGRACRAPDLGVRMITSVDVCILKPSEQFSSAYLTYLFSSRGYLSYVESLVRGGTRDRISRSMLGAIKIPAPPRNEQLAISSFLDHRTGRIDALSGRVEGAIERLQEYRAALITAVVTGNVDMRT